MIESPPGFNQGNVLAPPTNVEPPRSGNQRVITESAQILAHGKTVEGTAIQVVYTAPDQTYAEVKEILFSIASGAATTLDLYLTDPDKVSPDSDDLVLEALDPANGPVSLKTAMNPDWRLSFGGTGGATFSVRYHISGTESA